MASQIPFQSTLRDTLLSPSRGIQDDRAASSKSYGFGIRGVPPTPTTSGPGSFNPDPKSPYSTRIEPSRPTLESYPSYRSDSNDEFEDKSASEKRQADLRDQIDKEVKIKLGSENMLEALNSKSAKQTREQRMRVESELNASNLKIAQLRLGLEAEIQRSKDVLATSPAGRLTQLFQNAPARSPSRFGYEEQDVYSEAETESPTFVLAEILQSLEDPGMPSEYYVKRANDLVELFKRYPTLKYDLAWSIFGLRVQTMLLSDSDDVVAAGYRVVRYAITDLKSLKTIRALHTDYLVMLSLVKGSKATVEREQALKFVRAFLDVKDGVHEISQAVLRVVVAVAEHSEDRMRAMCILTLAEILVKAPDLIVLTGGLGILVDALAEGKAGLVGPFAYLLDTPSRRQCLRSGNELTGAFAVFTEGSFGLHEGKVRASAKVVIALFRTWPGLMTLSMNDFSVVRSLISSLGVQVSPIRDVILDIFFDVLNIKPPSWTTSFLAGRRLTTYGRVTNLREDTNHQSEHETEPNKSERDLVDHFTATILAVFLQAGLLGALIQTIEDELDPSVKKKATLLLGEALQMSTKRLPSTWAVHMQLLPSLFASASVMGAENRFVASGAIYQIDSINRILSRTQQVPTVNPVITEDASFQRAITGSQSQATTINQVDEGQFRTMLLETQVLTTVNFAKWRWDLIQKIIEGPLLNPKRFEEATKATKFVKRLLGFYRPFKYRFCEIRNTKPNQRYVRVGCALMRTLLETAEGIKYLAENKILPQIAECLAQVDRTSGLTSSSPLFSRERLSETLSGGYFAFLGVISSHPKGLLMMERWKMANMIFHIVELEDRSDLVKSLLGNMDYTLHSHLRVILSKALTSCSKDIRIFSTRLLRKYATRRKPNVKDSNHDRATIEWAIELLITQLYDPDIEVCEAAVRTLEEACDDINALEYVVKCRPALDHLGEIGAPLLLRFLSTSMGYRYLDGLDYISQEMDDWFLGRNDAYVILVEASLAKAFGGSAAKASSQLEDEMDVSKAGVAPPHFYRELARTEEGCRLLEDKGHFEEFVSIIRTHGMECDDPEIMLKVKGCLWAVGNVGSMELGAPFLEQTNAVKIVVAVAEGSSVMTMRGTAYFVLGLVSKSVHGQELLAEAGWDVSINEMGGSLGICLPTDLSRFFSMKAWPSKPETPTSPVAKPPRLKIDVSETGPENERILALVTDLGNTVLSKRSASELHGIKAKKPQGFQDHRLFERVMEILEQHHFRLPVLRFVYDLFDKGVMRRIVLEEDSDSEEG